MNGIDILISEVGPRDGLQSVDSIMPTEAKKAWIKAEAEAGVREIEVGSFVPPKLLPQLADTGEIVEYARTIPGLQVAALVPNFKGAENAIKAGAHKITLPLSVSETHSQANLRKTHAQVLEEVVKIVDLIKTLPQDARPHFEGGLSTAFGCTLEGHVPQAKVVEMAEKMIGLGCDEVGLADTTGYANPVQVKNMVKAIWAVVGRDKLTGIHLHNTRGQGLANVMAALDLGLDTLDSSLGGLGGCPFAPGASGNIITEDLVFLLDSMGLKTGIDLEKLMAVRDIVTEAIPDEQMYGFTPDAGLPKGYVQTVNGGTGWGTGN
ncbi:MAG: hydroxymethylglutaryl-CoA lyase [Rhodospirillaceae bacterium]|nr:hydroxymethylglutaryl-CoA lyase [Rhodospirillaceae bacterium]MBT5239270.1 hydroxymethylglutaryl-CoA lyase [Rhodospirillaceae bacterium]MBT5566126.1 hydroxymethylglutaryl-CoA lyase [Rhodospirillaceae bacterium]MBT6090617.1 hydroxymethylglutaryl-CoA lyase [Rhodospirillaceae bacterium]MBT6962054.1 hydroxymethylglutaryl-CoA lyase [Rhodospirillaceae bacterium]